MPEAAPMTSFGVAINITDIDRSVDFYQLLGLTELIRLEPAPGVTEVIMQWPGSSGPNLILMKTESQAGPVELGSGLSRLLAFVADIDKLVACLNDAGYEASAPGPVETVTISLAKDPDGFPVEIVQAGGG